MTEERGASEALIDLEDVTKTYKMGEVTVPALQEVTCRIFRGEMVAIVGPSGSGKSTMMNIIGCLDRPTSGRYVLEGREVGRLGDDSLARIRNGKVGFVFQSYNLLTRATAIANVELPLMYARAPHRRARALEALTRVGLTHRANHRPTELSGGEQQRVAIARALVNKPDIVLADEPTGNLDSRSTKDIVELFRDLNRDGITIIFVTHEQEVAGATRRILHLHDGRIVEDEVVSKP